MIQLDDVLGKKCKYCGVELALIFKTNMEIWKVGSDGSMEDGYCEKMHRAEHQKQLIQQGVIPDLDSSGGGCVMKDTRLRDKAGNPVWFPKDDRPYFDKALRRTFHSKKEKVQYMNDNKLVMDGSDTPRNLQNIPEAGDLRSRSFRKATQMED